MRRYLTSAIWAACATLIAVPSGTSAQDAPPTTWLDRPLVAWNKGGDTVAQPPAAGEAASAVVARCKLQPPQTTAAEKALSTVGWIPYWNVDQQLVRDDVEIVGGMRGADGMCRPTMFNLFVFVGGRFAGTLSPAAMIARTDASSGVVRLAPPQIAAEFARYAKNDPLCCPSSRVTVRYRIDRGSDGPVVVPVDVRTTRGDDHR